WRVAHHLSAEEGPGQNGNASAGRGRRQAASCAVRHAQASAALQPLTSARRAGDDWHLTSHGMSRWRMAGGSLADLNYWRRGGPAAPGPSISPNCREMTESHCTMSRINQAPATGNRCFISRFSRWSPERTCQVLSQREPLDVAVLRLSTAREAAGKSPTTSGVGASGSRMAARYTEIWCDAEPAASLS